MFNLIKTILNLLNINNKEKNRRRKIWWNKYKIYLYK